MYQFKKALLSGEEDVLLREALALVEAHGPNGLSLRSLAQKAGISPSLLNYRYGSRNDLIRRAFEHGHKLDQAHWDAREGTFDRLSATQEDLPSLALAVVTDMVTRTRQTSLVYWLFLTASEREPDLSPAAPGWTRLAQAFWARRLAEAGLDPELAAPYAAGLNGAVRIGLLVPGNLQLMTWLNDVVLRLNQRVLQKAPSSPGDSAARCAIEQIALSRPRRMTQSRTDTPSRIVEAASTLILSHGPDALTHRLIAEASGISLSSLTHHFGSLAEIQLHAFERIYDTARQQSVADIPSGTSIEQLCHDVLPTLFRKARARGRENLAMDEIMIASSRKPETAGLAGGLMAMTGQTSTSRQSFPPLTGLMARYSGSS